MNWFLSDENQRKAVAEIEQTKSHRAAAIAAAAFIERDLRNAIEARLRANKTLFEKLFKPTGALGAFETKADLGYLLEIYDADTHADICDFVWIRNRFAHNREPLQFDSRSIRERINRFRLIKRKDYPKLPGAGLPESLRSPPRLTENASPREKLTLTTKLLAIIFWCASHDRVIGPNAKKWAWRERD